MMEKEFFLYYMKTIYRFSEIRPGKSIYPQVTIHVNDYDELNMLIQKLNDACLYGVEVVKVNTINYSAIVIEYLLLFLCFFMLFEILCFVRQ